MIGIHAIGTYVPSIKLDNFQQGRRFGHDETFVKSKIGAERLPQIPQEMDTSDMAVRAVRSLANTHDLDLSLVEALVVVTQNGDGEGLPHTSAVVQHKLGLDSKVAAFDLSLGCSGYVYGLSVLRGLMEVQGMRNAILVTADPYSKIIERDDRVTSLLFGDAASATWLSNCGLWKFGRGLFETDGGGATNLIVREGKLNMNGRQVFNFASKTVPRQIRECLNFYGFDENEIDAYCMHQGSKSIVEVVASRFPDVKDRFVCDIRNTGNTVSSSIPLLLPDIMSNEKINKILVSGFGVGLSYATNILIKEKANDY